MTDTQQQPGRDWWPEEYVDEMMPAGRANPSAWLYRLDDGALRYGERDNHDWPTFPVAEGDVVKFISRDDAGLFKMTIQEDGTSTWDQPPPVDVTLFDTSDPEMSGEGPEEFEANLRDIDPPEAGQSFEVAACRWGDGVAFRFTALGGPPRFVPAS